MMAAMEEVDEDRMASSELGRELLAHGNAMELAAGEFGTGQFEIPWDLATLYLRVCTAMHTRAILLWDSSLIYISEIGR